MRDACSERDLLLSLRFAGSGLDYVVRRRVYDLGLRRHVRGCRAGLHSRRNTRPYVLTSVAPDCAPVITGNRPPRRAVAAITVVGLGASSPPSSSCSDERAASSKVKNHLVRPTLRRHACQQIRLLRCATFNVHSLANKVDVIRQCWLDAGLDVLGLTETWHEDAEDVSLRRLRSAGLQLLERARPVRPGARTNDVSYQNHGGVAVVASASVRLTKLNITFEPVTFEHLIARVTVAGSSFVFAVVYRPGSASATAAFFDEFRVLLEHLSSFATPYVISGDLNLRFDRPDDPLTLRAAELLDMFGAVQCVSGVTQDRGGTLDVVITRVEDRPTAVDIIRAPGGASDHRLVAWSFHAAKVETPVYKTQRRRSWRKFDVDQFRADLQSSAVCDGFISSSSCGDDSSVDDASAMASRLDEVVTALLDAHAPMTEITCRVRRSSDKWYDSECRSAKRRARGHERRFKRLRTDAARDSWMRSLKTIHHLVRSKRNNSGGRGWTLDVTRRLCGVP